MITVLVPNYNNAGYLNDFFQSLLSQTYKEFKVLFSDDCSTDNSIDIARSFRDKLDIEIIKTPRNLHLVGNLNFAIPQVKTKYLLKVDPDDYIEPKAIEIVLDKAIKDGLDICGCQLRTFGKYFTSEKNPIENTEIALVTSLFPCVAQFLFKTDVFDRIKYRDIKGAEDYDLWVQAVREKLKISAVDDILLNYRIHGSNATVTLKNSIDKTVISVRKEAILINYPDISEGELDVLSRIPSYGAKNKNELISYSQFLKSLIKNNSVNSEIFRRCLAKWFLRICLVSSEKVGFFAFITFRKERCMYNSLTKKERFSLFFITLLKLNESSKSYQRLKIIAKRYFL